MKNFRYYLFDTDIKERKKLLNQYLLARNSSIYKRFLRLARYVNIPMITKRRNAVYMDWDIVNNGDMITVFCDEALLDSALNAPVCVK